MSFKDRPSKGTWLLSDKEMDKVWQNLLSKVKVDRNHSVAYVAGYSKDGKTIYIDSEMPKGFNHAGKFWPTDRYLVLHETVEKSLEADPYFLHYLLAHQVALRTERDAVLADGLDWVAYNAFCSFWIKRIGSRASYPNTPKDLDLEPYREENDRSTLRKMGFANVQPQTPIARIGSVH